MTFHWKSSNFCVIRSSEYYYPPWMRPENLMDKNKRRPSDLDYDQTSLWVEEKMQFWLLRGRCQNLSNRCKNSSFELKNQIFVNYSHQDKKVAGGLISRLPIYIFFFGSNFDNTLRAFQNKSICFWRLGHWQSQWVACDVEISLWSIFEEFWIFGLLVNLEIGHISAVLRPSHRYSTEFATCIA